MAKKGLLKKHWLPKKKEYGYSLTEKGIKHGTKMLRTKREWQKEFTKDLLVDLNEIENEEEMCNQWKKWRDGIKKEFGFDIKEITEELADEIEAEKHKKRDDISYIG